MWTALVTNGETLRTQPTQHSQSSLSWGWDDSHASHSCCGWRDWDSNWNDNWHGSNWNQQRCTHHSAWHQNPVDTALETTPMPPTGSARQCRRARLGHKPAAGPPGAVRCTQPAVLCGRTRHPPICAIACQRSGCTHGHGPCNRTLTDDFDVHPTQFCSWCMRERPGRD